MVAFPRPNGIRPLVLGKRDVAMAVPNIWLASESVALDTLWLQFLRDVAPGEGSIFTEKGQLFTRQCADNPVSNRACSSTSISPVRTRLSTNLRLQRPREHGDQAG